MNLMDYSNIDTKEKMREAIAEKVATFSPELQKHYEYLRNGYLSAVKRLKDLRNTISRKKKNEDGFNGKVIKAAEETEKVASIALYEFESKYGIYPIGLAFFKSQCLRSKVKSFC